MIGGTKPGNPESGITPDTKLFLRNVGWNLLGGLAPLAAAVVSLPVLVHSIGVDRFGILALSWVLIGYFSLVDLGIGRALTQIVASYLGAGRGRQLVPIVWTSLLLMMILGLLAAIVLATATPVFVKVLLRIAAPRQAETIRTFYLLAAGLPIVIVTSGLRGILEAHQRFGLVNAIRLPLGVLTYLGPVLVLPFTTDVSAIVLTLILLRIGGLLAFGAFCGRVMPDLMRGPQLGRKYITPVLGMGSWMTASNVVSPIMSYLDRFVVGAILSLSAVAYYATPNEIVSRFLIVPSALVAVLFPAFAAASGTASDSARLYRRGFRLVFVLFFPLSLILISLAKPALSLWFGEGFAQHSAAVLQWLALGMFFNALATVPFAFIQGIGRADLTAKIHFIELPLYLVLLFGLIRSLGIEGVAIAWSARTGLDLLALTVVSLRLFSARFVLGRSVTGMVIAAILFLIASITWSPLRHGIILTLALVAFAGASAVLLLSDHERTVARRLLQPARCAKS